MRHHLVVVAPSMLGGVRAAGGWVFDRVAAGWDVTVLTADGTDSRALRILGVRGLDLDLALRSRVRGPRPRALAVDAALCESDRQLQRKLLDCVDGGMDIRLWGGRRAEYAADLPDGLPDGLPDDVPGCVRYRPSSAARAFKAHALAAAAASAVRAPAQCVSPDCITGDCTPAGPAPTDPAVRPTEVFWRAESIRPAESPIA